MALKKGYLFSLTVIILISLVALFFISQTPPEYNRNADVTVARIKQVEMFRQNVDEDAKTALAITSHRAFLSLEKDVLRYDGYIAEGQIKNIMQDLILNGTYHGAEKELLSNSTMLDWEQAIVSLAGQLGLDISFKDRDIRIWQEDPWHVLTNYQATVDVIDSQSQSQWHTTLSATANLSVTLFFDPLYTVETENTYFQRITQNTHPLFPQKILEHIQNRTYIASTNAPSYLERLKGKLTPPFDGYGIESLVHPQTLFDVGITSNESLVDWIYLGPASSGCHLVGAPQPWIVLDQPHEAIYGLSCT